MTDKQITQIQDARALKQAGLLPNIPLEHRTFSEDYSRHWFHLMNTHDAFELAMVNYRYGHRPGSSRKWRIVKQNFRMLITAGKWASAFTISRWKHDPEGQIMGSFIVQRAGPYAEYWHDVIKAVDDGGTLTIMPGDAPKWIDE